jgi:hypothetical protein
MVTLKVWSGFPCHNTYQLNFLMVWMLNLLHCHLIIYPTCVANFNSCSTYFAVALCECAWRLPLKGWMLGDVSFTPRLFCTLGRSQIRYECFGSRVLVAGEVVWILTLLTCYPEVRYSILSLLVGMVSATDHSCACCSAVPSPICFRHWLNKSSRQPWPVTVSVHFQHTYSNIVTFVAVIRQFSFHVLAKVHHWMKWNGQTRQTEIFRLNFSVGDGRFSGLEMWGHGLDWSGLR